MNPTAARPCSICVICGFIVFAAEPVLAQSAARRTGPRDASRVTGPARPIQAVAGDPMGMNMEIALEPRFNIPGGGTYNTGGLYNQSHIGPSNTVTVATVPPGSRVFWNVILRNWDPDGDRNPPLRNWQARVNDMGMTSGSGVPLTRCDNQLCTSSSQCATAFGESGSTCPPGPDPRFCNYAWFNRAATREDANNDRFRCDLPAPDCDSPVWDTSQPPVGGPLFFGSCPPEPCALKDPHVDVYGGTYCMNVPQNAKGTYTIPFFENETFATDPDSVFIPLAARMPGVLVVQSGACCRRFSLHSAECTDFVTSLDCDCANCTYHEDMTCAELDCATQLGACCDHGTEDSQVASCTETRDLECVCEKCDWTPGAACDEIVCDPNFTAIPTVSEWGLVILTLLFAAGGKVLFARRAGDGRLA